MLAIGFLSLLSVGFAVMATSDDDLTPEDEMGPEPDDLGFDPSVNLMEVARSDVEIAFQPGEDLTPSAEEQINQFVESVEDNPQQDIGDVVNDLHEVLDGIAENGAATDVPQDTTDADNADPDAQNASQIERPPMGDEYRDPLRVAEELEAQTLALEAEAEAQRAEEEALLAAELAASEAAGQPLHLVSVQDESGETMDDTQVLEGRFDDPDTEEPKFQVTAPDSENEIEVTYDPEHTFKIEYNAQTTSVTAGLNSIIEGPDGARETEEINNVDDNGIEFTEVVRTASFDSSTDITINVAQDDIGPHVAQIELINPQDALHFEFDEETTSNFHLVYQEIEEGRTDFSDTTKRAYVIETSADVTNLDQSDIARILAEDDPQSDTGRLVSEIYLGEDSFFVGGDPDDGTPYEHRISNFINDDPQITANVDWASVSEYGQDEVASSPAAGANDDDNWVGPTGTLNFGGFGSLF